MTDKEGQETAELCDQVMNDITQLIIKNYKPTPQTLAAVVLGLCYVAVLMTWTILGREKAPHFLLRTMLKCIQHRKNLPDNEKTTDTKTEKMGE